MDKISDGGPAFPMPPYRIDLGDGGFSENAFPQHGLTIRDWFAGQALANLESALQVAASDRAGQQKWIAQQAYEIADALIAARSGE